MRIIIRGSIIRQPLPPMICNNLRRDAFNCFISSIPVEVLTCHLVDKRVSYRFSFDSTKQNGGKIIKKQPVCPLSTTTFPRPSKKWLPKRQLRKEKTFSLCLAMFLDSFCKRGVAQWAICHTVHCSQSLLRHPIAERCQNTKRAGISERGNDVLYNKTHRERKTDELRSSL